jgi:uncharacterized protein
MTSEHAPPSISDASSVTAELGPRTPTLVGVGVVGGAIGALLGGGTGLVTVPALDKLTALKRVTVHGTTTIPNIGVAVVGAAVYALRGGAIYPTVGIPLMIGGVAGALFGARLVAHASETVLRSVFIAVLILAGAKLLFDATGADPIHRGAVLPDVVRHDAAIVIGIGLTCGVIIGAWSAAMGLGGGLLTVPILVLLFGTSLHTAEGTSLVVMLPNAIAGAVAHIRQHTASVPIGSRLAAGAGVGAIIGALIALELNNTTLGIVFGIFVLAMALREAMRLRRARRTATHHTLTVRPASDRSTTNPKT